MLSSEVLGLHHQLRGARPQGGERGRERLVFVWGDQLRDQGQIRGQAELDVLEAVQVHLRGQRAAAEDRDDSPCHDQR